MAKNIVIYSDGTGQRSGVLFDERRSNIYKLYRATRCGPDSAVNPADQFAFYDPGIGTTKGGSGLIATIKTFVYNTVCQASGLGLTGNIVDCYATLVRNWRPGDRIFLLGFSRGAYTVRCLGAVIALCGVPTMDGDQPLKRDMDTSKRIAKEAVKRVYQHTHSRPRANATPRQNALLDQRLELAERFRGKHCSGDRTDSNVYPHFIGVFDTVAALSNPTPAFFAILIGLLAVISPLMWLVSRWVGFDVSWAASIAIAIIAAALVAWGANLSHRVRWEIGLKHCRWWWPLHLLDWRMRFYDMTLNINVQYARHAIAIDERRKSFDRVGWGTRGDWPYRPKGGPEWFQQVWFAGCHADIGGGYLEDESRLSDTALQWMLDAAVAVGLKYDASVLKLYPDAAGHQHDETRRLPFKFLPKIDRDIDPHAPLHPTVLQRFQAAEVLQYDLYAPYRPKALSRHSKLASFFGPV